MLGVVADNLRRPIILRNAAATKANGLTICWFTRSVVIVRKSDLDSVIRARVITSLWHRCIDLEELALMRCLCGMGCSANVETILTDKEEMFYIRGGNTLDDARAYLISYDEARVIRSANKKKTIGDKGSWEGDRLDGMGRSLDPG